MTTKWTPATARGLLAPREMANTYAGALSEALESLADQLDAANAALNNVIRVCGTGGSPPLGGLDVGAVYYARRQHAALGTTEMTRDEARKERDSALARAEAAEAEAKRLREALEFLTKLCVETGVLHEGGPVHRQIAAALSPAPAKEEVQAPAKAGEEEK